MGVDKTLSLSDGESGIDSLCSVENDTYYNYFFESIKAEFNKLGLQVASTAVNESLKEIDRGELDNKSKVFTEYLEELFPDGGETTSTPPVPDPVDASTSTEDSSDEEQSGTPKDQGTESITGELGQRLTQILIKPESERTDEEKTLIQLLQKTSVGTESNETSTTQENSTDQSGGVILEEVVSDEINTPDE